MYNSLSSLKLPTNICTLFIFLKDPLNFKKLNINFGGTIYKSGT